MAYATDGLLGNTRLASVDSPGVTKAAVSRANQGAPETGAPRSEPTYSWLATLVKVDLALLPIAVMALKQVTTIRANITAYSTAVGPSSDFKKRSTLQAKFFIRALLKLVHPIVGQPEKLKT